MNSQTEKVDFLRKVCFKLIEWLTPEFSENIIGDLDEVFNRQLKKGSRLRAHMIFFWEVLNCLKLLVNKQWFRGSIMSNQHLKMSWRVLVKNRSYALINVIGLSVGLAASVIIFLFVRTERSYDQYHKNSQNIYRLVYDVTGRNEKLPWAISTGKWVDLIAQEYPEVNDFVRIIPTWGSKSLMKSKEEGFYENGFVWADPSITTIFDFDFVAGDPTTALNDSHTIIISEQMAKKYFGDPASAIGQSINRDNETNYKVTGVFKPMPSNSHFHAEFIASLMIADPEDRNRFWSYSYLLINDAADIDQLQGNFPDLVEKHVNKDAVLKLGLQPLESIYLESELLYEFEPVGNRMVTYIFSGVGLFILLIACVNFINLATAYGSKRIKEIGIKKVLGSNRSNLVRQLITESLLITVFAMIAASVIVILALPQVEFIAGKSLNLIGLLEWKIILIVVLMILSIGILAGSYPAFYIASFEPKQIFDKGTTRAKGTLRKVLTVFQFALSITLIIGSIVIYLQLRYFQEKDMGMEPSQALVLPLDYAQNIKDNYNAFRNELMQNPNVQSTSMMSNLPGELIRMWTGDVRPSHGSEEDVVRSKVFTSDYDFVETLGVNIQEGRNFSRNLATDSVDAVLINETAAKALSVDVGDMVTVTKKEQDYRVIGIVDDFHFASLHSEIEPLLIYNKPGPRDKLVIRLNTEKLSHTLDFIASEWVKHEPDRPMESFFLNEYFNEKYVQEKSSMRLIIAFTILAVFIACLGLFGLATYVMNSRLKEIGVRKVFGASIIQLFTLLASEFVWLVVIAFIFVSPIAYYVTNQWLDNFAYRIDFSLWIFILAGLMVLLMAILTVSYKSIYVAKTNPTKVLADE